MEKEIKLQVLSMNYKPVVKIVQSGPKKWEVVSFLPLILSNFNWFSKFFTARNR